MTRIHIVCDECHGHAIADDALDDSTVVSLAATMTRHRMVYGHEAMRPVVIDDASVSDCSGQGEEI